MKTRIQSLVGGAAAALLLAQAAFAQPAMVDPAAAGALGRSIASAAAVADRASAGVEVERAVTGAAQQVIINSAADPRLVLAALDQALAACRTPGATRNFDWSCPGSGAAINALAALRGIVLAQVDQTGPASIGTRGYAAFGSIPTTSAGGAGYLVP